MHRGPAYCPRQCWCSSSQQSQWPVFILFLYLYFWIFEFHSRSLMLCFQNAFAIYYREATRTSSIYCLVVHYQVRRSPGKKSWNLLVTNDKLIIWFLFTSQLFDKILCFSQPNFQPSTTHKFVMDLALNQLIFDCINFVHLICEHQALGAHTDIIVFQATTIKNYRWSHSGACPKGNRKFKPMH